MCATAFCGMTPTTATSPRCSTPEHGAQRRLAIRRERTQ